MKTINLLLLLLLSFVMGESSLAEVKSKKVLPAKRSIAQSQCNFVRWPFGNQEVLPKDYATLQKLDRKLVYQYFLAELSQSPMRLEVVKGLYRFLAGSEPSEDLRAFLEVCLSASGVSLDERVAAKALSAQDVCELYKKVKPDLPLE
jgi:hypothetical protein